MAQNAQVGIYIPFFSRIPQKIVGLYAFFPQCMWF